MKKRVGILLTFIVILFSAMHVQAYTIAEQQPNNESHMLRWMNIMLFDAHLSISSGRAFMTGTVIARSGTESITVNAALVRINANGTTTHIWSQNGLQTNGDTWIWERPHHVARGYDYRLTLTVTAVRDGVSETATRSHTAHAH